MTRHLAVESLPIGGDCSHLIHLEHSFLQGMLLEDELSALSPSAVLVHGRGADGATLRRLIDALTLWSMTRRSLVSPSNLHGRRFWKGKFFPRAKGFARGVTF